MIAKTMTPEQALEWLEGLSNMTGDQVCAEIEDGKALSPPSKRRRRSARRCWMPCASANASTNSPLFIANIAIVDGKSNAPRTRNTARCLGRITHPMIG